MISRTRANDSCSQNNNPHAQRNSRWLVGYSQICYRLLAIGHSTSAALNRWHKGYHVVRRQQMLPRDVFRTDRDQEIFVPRFQTGNGVVQPTEQLFDRRLVADFSFLGSM